MPGTWPPSPTKPYPFRPDDPAQHHFLAVESIRDFQRFTHGFITKVGGWILGALHGNVWHTEAPQGVVDATDPTQIRPETAPDGSVPSPKRRKFSDETEDEITSSRGSSPSNSPSRADRRRARRIRRSPTRSALEVNNPGFFSVDMAYPSDSSEDGEASDSSMEIDSLEPEVPLAYNKHMPPAPDKAGPTSAPQPNIEANLSPTAVHRAVTLFPGKDSQASDETVESSKASAVAREATTYFSETPDSPSPRKNRYQTALEFFPEDVSYSLPGLGVDDTGLPADIAKAEHLKRELVERLRKEELEAQNAALKHLGLRRPKSELIRNTSPQWVNRAFHAPENGKFDPTNVHPDAVELQPRDFAKLVPETAWLNDDCVHSSLCCLAASINKKAGVKPKIDTPKCVAISSLYWMAFCGDHKKLYPRPFSRKWNMKPENFLDIDTVLIPVNLGAHWTLIVIRPSRRTVSYIDSFQKPNEVQLNHAYKWLELFLGPKFVASDWKTEGLAVPRQTNAWDCGVFVITNAMCLSLGISPMCYGEEHMPMQRLRIAAMLLNGGFHGEFDLDYV